MLKAINSGPLFSMEVKRFDHGIWSKISLCKLLMVKIELPECGHIWNPHC